MLSDDDNIRLSRLFFDLVMRCGLSGMEAISYGLTRVMGFTPMNASVEINEIQANPLRMLKSPYMHREA